MHIISQFGGELEASGDESLSGLPRTSCQKKKKEKKKKKRRKEKKRKKEKHYVFNS